MMMGAPQINHGQAKALAKLIHELRPDWDETGVLYYLGKTRERPVSADEVCHAAIRAAMSAHNRTPAVIALEGPHWLPAAAPDRPRRQASPDQLCRTCGSERSRCVELAAVADDGHEFDPLTGPPPNLDRRTGELVKPPPEVLADLRELLRPATSSAEPEGPPTKPPSPTPEPAVSTQGDS